VSTGHAGGQPPDIKRALVHLLARAYKLGPDPAGAARYTYADGTPVDPAWPAWDFPGWDAGDFFAATCYLAHAFMELAFEADAAQAEGRAIDVPGVLDRLEMALILREGGPELLARLAELGCLPDEQAAR
jgi:hypothetical protein